MHICWSFKRIVGVRDEENTVGLPEVIVNVVISLYHGVKVKVSVCDQDNVKNFGCKLVYIKNLSCLCCFFQFLWM